MHTGHENDADGGVAAALATVSNPVHGDLYNVGGNLNNDNYVWNATSNAWDKLASSFSLPAYLSENALDGKYLQLANAGSLATKSEVSESDLASALAAKVTSGAEAKTAVDAILADAPEGYRTLAALKNAIDGKQASLTQAQLDAVNSGITEDVLTNLTVEVQTISGELGDKLNAGDYLIDTIQVKHNGSSEFVSLVPLEGTKTVQLDLSSYLKSADLSIPVTDVQVKGSGDSAFATVLDGTVAKVDLSAYAKTADLPVKDVQVKAIIDAAAATQA